MMRILGTVIGIFCTATVMTGSILVGLSWSQGNLNPETSREIVAIMQGAPRPRSIESEDVVEEMTSFDEIVEKRTEKILRISARESELDVLKQAIDDQTALVMSERKKLEQVKKTFREELDKEYEKIKSESVEQARAILLKMDPESAVEKLTSLETEEAVLAIKGMAEKDAARILDQFRERIAGKDPLDRIEKAEEIYKAIFRGDPLIAPAEAARQALQSQPTAELDR